MKALSKSYAEKKRTTVSQPEAKKLKNAAGEKMFIAGKDCRH